MTVFPLAQSSVMFVMSHYLTQVQIYTFLRDYLKHSSQVKSQQWLAHYKIKTQVTAHTLSEKKKKNVTVVAHVNISQPFSLYLAAYLQVRQGVVIYSINSHVILKMV